MTLNNRVEALLRLQIIPRETKPLPADGFLYQGERSILRLLTRPIDPRGARIWYIQEYHEARLGELVGSYVAGDPLDYMMPEELADLEEYVRELEKRVSLRSSGTLPEISEIRQQALPYKD